MKIEKLGPGKPEIAFIGCIHGDEVCGKKAIDRLINSNLDLQKGIKLVLANEKAYEENKHYIDKDLNRSFPGNSDSKIHEEHLAAELVKEVKGLKVLDLHSSKEDEKKFGIVTTPRLEAYETAKSTGLSRIVDFSPIESTVIPNCTRIAAECGILGTDNAEKTAFEIMENFLAAEGAVNKRFDKKDPEYFKIKEKVNGKNFNFVRTNFEKIRKGEVYAVKEGKEKVAEEDFYPVLMSDNGYEGYIGFKANKIR